MPITPEISAILLDLQAKSGLSYEQIGKEVGTSGTNVGRYIKGQVKAPDSVLLNEIILAIGGEPDSILTPKAPAPRQSEDMTIYQHLAVRHAEEITRLQEAHQQVIQAYKEDIAYKKRTIHIMAVAICFLVLFILAVFLIDILNPNVGWFRKALGATADAGWKNSFLEDIFRAFV